MIYITEPWPGVQDDFLKVFRSLPKGTEIEVSVEGPDEYLGIVRVDDEGKTFTVTYDIFKTPKEKEVDLAHLAGYFKAMTDATFPATGEQPPEVKTGTMG